MTTILDFSFLSFLNITPQVNDTKEFLECMMHACKCHTILFATQLERERVYYKLNFVMSFNLFYHIILLQKVYQNMVKGENIIDMT